MTSTPKFTTLSKTLFQVSGIDFVNLKMPQKSNFKLMQEPSLEGSNSATSMNIERVLYFEISNQNPKREVCQGKNLISFQHDLTL